MISRRHVTLGVAFLLVGALAFGLGIWWAGSRGRERVGDRDRLDGGGEVELRLDPSSVSLLPDAGLHLDVGRRPKTTPEAFSPAAPPGSSSVRPP